MGLVGIISVAAPGARTLKRLREAANALPHLEPLLKAQTISNIARHADPVLVQAVTSLSAESKEEVIALVEEFATGTLRSMNAVARVAEITGPSYQELVATQRILRVFSDDVASFRNPVLAANAAYVSRGGTSSAANWARAQRPRSRYHLELTSEIGADYRDVIRIAQQTDTFAVVAEDVLPRILDAIGAPPDSYRDLANLRRRLGRDLGRLLEADHLLEQRFFMSPRVEDVLDPADIFATLVPRNPAVARQIPNYASYVHSEKTSLLRRLIPIAWRIALRFSNGATHTYTPTAPRGRT